MCWQSSALGAPRPAFFANSLAEDKIDEAARIREYYENGGSNTDYDTYAADYSAAIQDSDQKILFRNLLYGCAGAGAVGFAISFAF